MSIRNPSITYLIASTGRETLKDTLRSLHGQFAFGLDKVNLYFDGKCEKGLEFFKEELDMFGEDISYKVLDETLGYWGHGVRNKYQYECSTDYIHHMDDDDIYCEGCIPHVRSILKENYGKVIIFKFRTHGGRIVWSSKAIQSAEVGTPSGFIFNRPEIMGTWNFHYGGDYSFYEEVKEKIGMENLVFHELLIVKTRPKDYGY